MEILLAAKRAQEEVARLEEEIRLARANPSAEEAFENLEIQGVSRLASQDLLLVEKELWRYSEGYLKRAAKEARRQRKRRET